jgi:hypothetical protein
MFKVSTVAQALPVTPKFTQQFIFLYIYCVNPTKLIQHYAVLRQSELFGRFYEAASN